MSIGKWLRLLASVLMIGAIITLGIRLLEMKEARHTYEELIITEKITSIYYTESSSGANTKYLINCSDYSFEVEYSVYRTLKVGDSINYCTNHGLLEFFENS